MHKRLVPAARLGILGFVAAAFAACGDDNRAPALGLILDQQVIIGNTLSLVLTADDPDGDRLDFDVSGLPKTARVTPRAANEAVLVWSPLITDTQPGGRRYEVEVAVDDGRGGSARQSIGVVVYPTFGVPAFTLPAGIVVNLGQQDDLELLVEVKDDDSTEVEIALDEGPEGAKLQRADKKVAHFFWRPDDAQRQVAVHRAIFSARDESHAPITHVLTIVLLNAEKQSGCEGAPPTVAHAPPLDQTFAGSLALGASATDGQSQVQSMTLHWTRGDPNGAYTAIAMTRLSNDGPDWRATLDGQALGALPNDGALVHYYLEATDNDDPTGVSCDQTTRVPKAGFFTVGLYPPGAAFDACVDDPAEPDGSAGQAATVKPGVYAGRRLCGADLDLLGLDAPAGTTVVAALRWNEGDDMPAFDLVDRDGNTLVSGDVAEPGRLQLVYERPDDRPIYVAVAGGFGSRQSYTLELTVGATRCEDDAAEPDSQPGEARVLPRDTEVEQKICAGDSDYFRLSVAGGERVHIEAAFDHRYGDLDLELRAADGATVLASSTSEKSLEAVDWTAEGATDLLVRVYGVEGASNSYTIVAGDAVITGCEPDGLGDNATPESAVVLYQGVYEGFHACDEAADWFAVDFNGGETLSVLVLTDAPPHVAIRAYRDPNGAPIATAEPDGDGFAELTVEAGRERLYYQVVSTGGAATYALLQEVADPPGACVPDRYEPNPQGAAVALDPGIHTWLRMCGDGDVDAFAIDVPAFTNLIVFTNHTTGDAYTDIELLTSSGQELYSEQDLGDGAYLEELIEQAGTYVLLVKPFGVGEGGLGYDIGVFTD